MGNKQKIGSRRNTFKKRKGVGLPKCSVAVSSPQTNQSSTRPMPTSPKPTHTPKTSSSRKYKVESNFSYYSNKTETLEYDIVDLNLLFSAFGELAVCKNCHHKLSFEKRAIEGLATQVHIFCSNCNEIDKAFDNCCKIEQTLDGKQENFYDINLRLVNGLRSIGKGQTAGQILCGVLNLPPPPSKYSKYEYCLSAATETLCKESMKTAVEQAVSLNDGVRDLCVAVDGSWQRRGHCSLNGVLTLTSVDTGKVLDVSVMSKYCKCPSREKNIHMQTCEANYLGSSGGMEVAGAIELFSRSEELYNARYLFYLGDGDTKAYASVCEAQVYGPDIKIEKLECVGHVQKRMGTRLLNMRKQKTVLSDGKSLTGKNRLTTAAVQKIQTFYGLAIRRNTHSVQAMRQAVWALYSHVMSTNEKPVHILCPEDEDTWCKYNRSKLEKTVYDHNKHFHLPQVIMEHIKPVFKDLVKLELLEKCLKGKTQNPNESLNNVIWSIIPKRVFVTLPTLKYGVYSAICTFNDGFISKVKIMEQLGLSPGKNLVIAMTKLEKVRLRKAEKAAEDQEKKIRQARTLKKRKLEDLFEDQEDPNNPSYSAGHY